MDAMDAIDLMILNKSLVAAAAGAAPSSNQLYSLVGALEERREPLNQLYAELGALREILEALRTNLDGSLSRLTKNQQQMLQECRQIIQDYKIVCDELFVELSDNIRPSAWENGDVHDDLVAISDAAAKLHIWKMRLEPMAKVIQFNPENTDMAKAHEVEKAVENTQRAISIELRQVDFKLRSFSQPDVREETDPAVWNILQKILLPWKIRQAALSKSIRVCETVAEVLKEKQTPEIAEYIAIEHRCDFTLARQAAVKKPWVRHSGSICTSEYD
ncbi:hypothetical protein ACHAPE_003893 [Trichoderma viride]